MVEKVKPLAMYCAIYRQPLNGEYFDEEKATWLRRRSWITHAREVMSAGTFYSQVRKYKEGLADELPVSNYTSEEEAAGFKRLNETFGFYATLDNIARAIWDVQIRKPFRLSVRGVLHESEVFSVEGTLSKGV